MGGAGAGATAKKGSGRYVEICALGSIGRADSGI